MIFFDTETTGISHKKHGIIQLACILQGDKGELLDRFSADMNIFPDQEIDDYALSVNGKTREDIAGFPEPVKVFERFKAFFNAAVEQFGLTRLNMTAYNVEFDKRFLNEWLQRCDSTFVLDVPFYCAMAQAKRYFKRPFANRPGNNRLTTVAEHLGIPVDTDAAHSALYDAELCRQVYNIVAQEGGTCDWPD